MKDTLKIQNHEIYISDTSVRTLASECSTPLYIYDLPALKQRMAEFKDHFVSNTLKTHVIYASKAFSCLAMNQLVSQYGFSLDVVSGGELYTALQSNFDLSRVYFHGNNKSDDELNMAIELGVGTIVVDNLMEAKRLVRFCENPKHKIHVLLRVNPGIEAHTHKYIQTAFIDSKFGISTLDTDEIKAVIDTIQTNSNLQFDGFHAHIGSQIFELDAFKAEIEKICQFVQEFQNQTKIQVRTLDFGGGFGVRYTDEDQPVEIALVCKTIVSEAEKQIAAYELSVEEICIEPGRSIIAEAGYQLYTIGDLKQTPNRNYIFVDGGMTDNIRPVLYQADYDFDIATNADAPKTKTVCIAGKCCESGDLLAENTLVQPYQTNDLLLVSSTGAYGYSMASNYNKLAIPSVVFVDHGKIIPIIKRQTYQDLIQRENLIDQDLFSL